MTAIQAEFHRLQGATASEITAHFMNNFGVVAQQYLGDRLWLLDYDQLASHKYRTTDVVMEARGIVLCAQTLDIVRRPFARFFNIGEAPSYEADIDYARLQALEKVDGSLVPLYFNKVSGHWHFGTRGTPFAEGSHRLGGPFYRRVLTAAKLPGTPATEEFDRQMDALLEREVTYLFEFIGPENPHVTPYATSELVLLGARHWCGPELTPPQVHELYHSLLSAGWNVRLPKTYAMPVGLSALPRSQQVAAIQNWVAESPEFKGLHEGVVCRDPLTGKRVKVKTPLYCAAHLQGGGEGINLSLARIVELVVNGDADEFCLYLPHLAPIVNKAQDQVTSFLQKLVPLWEQVKSIEGQKDFALAVQAQIPSSASGIFFQARKTSENPMAIWGAMNLQAKTRLAERLISL